MACALCGADRPQPLVRLSPDRYLQSMQVVPAVATKVMCADCGHIYENPQFEARELERLYRTLYRSPALGYATHAPDAEYLYWKTLKAQRDRQWLARYSPWPLAGLRVLEIGCAEGLLLSMLAREGCHVTGVETTDSYAEHARTAYGLDVCNSAFEDTDFGSERFDLIVALKVLEHAKQPLRFAERVAALLRPQGAFYVTVPNALRPDQTPTEFLASVHLSLFTESSIRHLLSRAGLAPLHIDEDSRFLSVLARLSPAGAAAQQGRPVAASAARWAIRRYRVQAAARALTARLRRGVKAGLYAVVGASTGERLRRWLNARGGSH